MEFSLDGDGDRVYFWFDEKGNVLDGDDLFIYISIFQIQIELDHGLVLLGHI